MRPYKLSRNMVPRHGGLFPFGPPYKEILKGNVPLASGKQGVALQAGDFALLDITKLDRDDLIFCLANRACEENRF